MQLNYTMNHDPAYLGTWAANSPVEKAITAKNSNGSEIPFGRGVTNAATPSTLGHFDYTPTKLPTANTDRFEGVAVHSMTFEAAHPISGTRNGPQDGEVYSLARMGIVNVWVEDAVGPGSPVYWRVAANGAGTAPGQFRATADGTNTVAVTNARFRGRTTGAGIVALEINLP